MNMPVRPMRLCVFACAILLSPVMIFSLGNGAIAATVYIRTSMCLGRLVRVGGGPGVLPLAYPAGSMKLQVNPLSVIAGAIFTPFDGGPGGSIVAPDGMVYEYPPPRAYSQVWGTRMEFVPGSNDSLQFDASGMLRITWGALYTGDEAEWLEMLVEGLYGFISPSLPWTILAQSAAAAVSMMLLPTTLRRCRVRSIHIARMFVYSMWLTAIALAAPPLITLLSTLMGVRVPAFLRMNLQLILVFATPVALAAWWAAGARWYLRLPHAWGVGIVASAIGTLVGLLVNFELLTWLCGALE
jgi:hypothetical protein